jgi:pimeloyl-ACP methyl ester carboxylesterase
MSDLMGALSHDVPASTAEGTSYRCRPHVAAAGTGPGVMCLHSNASTSAQWARLMACLAPTFRVSAVDLYGAGGSPSWPHPGPLRLNDEVDLIESVLSEAAPLALVGHSYGAAVALVAALRNPGRVRAVALYEPTLFALIDAKQARPNNADGIRNAVARAKEAVASYDTHLAAEVFVDYRSGPGAWATIPAQRNLEWLEARYRRLESRASPDGRERWLNWAIWSVLRRACAGYMQTTMRSDGVACIAYVLLSGFRGEGLGTRAVAAMMRRVRQRYGTRTFEAGIDARNLTSIALVRRLGFRASEVAETGAPDVLYRRTQRPANKLSRLSCSDGRFHSRHGQPALQPSRYPS